MTLEVPLAQLRAELERRGNSGYLLTVGAGSRPHCVAVELAWEGDHLTMGAGMTSVRNAAVRSEVAILSPPAPSDSGGYILIVDAAVSRTVDAGEGRNSVTLRPTHAVLHRPAVAPDGTPAHDCVHLYDAEQTVAT